MNEVLMGGRKSPFGYWGGFGHFPCKIPRPPPPLKKIKFNLKFQRRIKFLLKMGHCFFPETRRFLAFWEILEALKLVTRVGGKLSKNSLGKAVLNEPRTVGWVFFFIENTEKKKFWQAPVHPRPPQAPPTQTKVQKLKNRGNWLGKNIYPQFLKNGGPTKKGLIKFFVGKSLQKKKFEFLDRPPPPPRKNQGGNNPLKPPYGFYLENGVPPPPNPNKIPLENLGLEKVPPAKEKNLAHHKTPKIPKRR